MQTVPAVAIPFKAITIEAGIEKKNKKTKTQEKKRNLILHPQGSQKQVH